MRSISVANGPDARAAEAAEPPCPDANEVQDDVDVLGVSDMPMNSGGSLPPTGSLQEEWRRCGHPRCRCTRGTLHGPYWYLRWREAGRQRRRYVLREQVNAMRAAIAERRRLRPPAWSLRQELAELRRLAREVRDDGHT